MAQIEITINDRAFKVGCEDGQEARLRELANYVDNKVRGLVRQMGGGSDLHLMVLTSLLLADEVFDLMEAPGRADTDEETADSTVLESETATEVETLAHRIEGIAADLERS